MNWVVSKRCDDRFFQIIWHMAPRSEERKMFTLKVLSIYLTEKKYILYICTSKLKKGLIYSYFTIEKNVDF